jgi:hypothetical protein
MANLNSIQMNQPVRAFNSNQSINGDSQESNIDQSFTSFPDELEAAKGQSQNASTGANSSDAKPETIENIDLQNLPLTAAVNLANPANIAAVIQVVTPLESTSPEALTAEQLQLMAINAQNTLPTEMVANELVSEVSANSDAVLNLPVLPQVSATPAALSASHQDAEALLANQNLAVDAKQDLAAVTPQILAPNVVGNKVTVEEVVTDAANKIDLSALPSAAEAVNVAETKVDVTSQETVLADNLSQVVSVSNQSVNQVVANSNNTGSSVEVSDSSTPQAVNAVNSGKLLDLNQASQVASSTMLEQADTTLTVDKKTAADFVAAGAPTNSASVVSNQISSATATDSSISSDAQALTVANLIVESSQSETGPASVSVNQVDNSIDLVKANGLDVAGDSKVANVDANKTSAQVIANQNLAVNMADESATLDTSIKVEQVATQSEFVVDGEQIQVSRDSLAQSEEILEIRSENAKLAKVDSGVQVDAFAATDMKDMIKVDTVSSGILMSDIHRSTFSVNADQELKLSQSAPVKLEPHNVSLATGPLNIEVMRVLKEGGGRVIMEVTPPDQGTLQLDLRLDNQGKAILVVDGASDSTRARLEQGSAELRQQLADMGLQLSLNMRQKSDSEGQFRFASSSDGFSNHKNSSNDSASRNEAGVIVPNQINSDGRVHLYA